MSAKLVEVRITKGVLFLTPEEFAKGLKRGKAIKRQRSFDKRIVERKSHG